MPDIAIDVPAAADLDLDAVEDLVDGHRAGSTEPGLAYGVVLDGRLVHSGGRGERCLGGTEPGPDTVFRIASMTKSFTAATVLSLRDAGLLRLDDEVSRYVPEAAALRPPTDDASPITVRSLLTMTAGFPTDDPWGDRQQDLPDEEFARLLAGGLSFAWTPGTAWEYSNLGYALLGRVVAAAAGTSYPQAVARLLRPLGLDSTVFSADAVPAERLAHGHRRIPGVEAGPGRGWEEVPFAAYGSFASMGGLFSTVRDLARWVGGFTGAFPPRNGPDAPEDPPHPLARSSRREMQLPHLGLPPTVVWRSIAEPPLVRGSGYGFGLVVERDPMFGTIVSHSGGYPGFGSHMRWHPASGIGVVLLGNATYAPMARLGTRLVDALLASGIGVGRRRSGDSSTILPAAFPAPGAGVMAAATEAARSLVESLFTRWDDGVAARLFAMNVDLDDPLEMRRARIEQLASALGPLKRDGTAEAVSTSPAHCLWWLAGPGGRVRVEIRMSPELPPRVQTLTVTAVPTPPAAHRWLAGRVADLIGDPDARWPADLRLGPGLDPGRLSGQLATASAWAGRCRVTEVVAAGNAGGHAAGNAGGHPDGGGRVTATYRLDGERCALALTLDADPAAGLVSALTLVPLM